MKGPRSDTEHQQPRDGLHQAWSGAQSGKQPAKRVALFGGSFNPPHDGHFALMQEIAANLGVDEIWMIFSHNRFKDESNYAPLEDRLEMAEILSRHYPDLPVVFSDVEQRVGTNITADILRALKTEQPDTDFVWVMGSDNLEQFHKWQNYEYIMENFEISVVNRPGYDNAAEDSVTAKEYAQYQKQPQEDLGGDIKGWSYMHVPGMDLSSTALLTKLRAGQRNFDGGFQDVADFIVRKGLYGINGSASPSAERKDQPRPK